VITRLAALPRPLRLLGFGVAAMLATFAVIAVVMFLFDPPRAIESAVYDQLVDDVQVVDLRADPELRRAVEDSIAGRAPSAEVEHPQPRSEPPYAVPPREVRGFVQVEVRLDERGQVIEAKVVGAIPPGVYERQALAQVRARRYAPITVEGRAVPGKVTEVIDFTVPAAAPAARKGG
jgi:TonB family protein